MRYVKKTPIMVGFDLDGVIIDHTENKILLAAQYGFRLDRYETASDIMRQKLPIHIYTVIQQQLYADIPLPKEPPLMDGVISAFAILQKSDIPFVLISRRRNLRAAIALLERHNMVPRYFSGDRMFFVYEPEDKNEKAREIGVTHFVDDEMGVLSVLPDVGCRILFDPHGVFVSSNEYKRVESFGEIISLLEKDFQKDVLL